MPGFDRTGPEGKGSRTGRGLGKCNPNNQNSDQQNDLGNYPRRLRVRKRMRGNMENEAGAYRGKGRDRISGWGHL